MYAVVSAGGLSYSDLCSVNAEGWRLLASRGIRIRAAVSRILNYPPYEEPYK